MGKARARRRGSQITLDAGALLAIGRGDRRMLALIDQVLARGGRFLVPSGVLAQALRSDRDGSVLARFIIGSEVVVVPLDEPLSRACGELMAAAGTDDVVQASVVIVARQHGNAIVSGHAADLGKLDPAAEIAAL